MRILEELDHSFRIDQELLALAFATVGIGSQEPLHPGLFVFPRLFECLVDVGFAEHDLALTHLLGCQGFEILELI